MQMTITDKMVGTMALASPVLRRTVEDAVVDAGLVAVVVAGLAGVVDDVPAGAFDVATGAVAAGVVVTAAPRSHCPDGDATNWTDLKLPWSHADLPWFLF